MESLKKKEANLTYLEWNDKIAEYFFNPQKEGARGWFSVERELIDKISKENDATLDDFIKIIKDGPEWINRPNQKICSKAHAVFQEWDKDRKKYQYPPYIAYLALFVLAVNHGDNEDFSEGNYYGPLSDLVGENLSTNHFRNIPELWDDLEKWSLEDKEGAIVNWEKDFPATTKEHNFRYKGEKYKIFTSAEELGISGWISNQRYSPKKLFYLAVHKDLFDKVQEWGNKQCEQCEELKFSGLPKDWHLFKIKEVKEDILIKDVIPALSIDKKQRIQFKGGLRLSRGNKFFSFTPPKFSITGGTEKSNLYWFSKNNVRRKPLIRDNKDMYLFSLPKDIPVGERIIISNRETESKEEERKISFMLLKNHLKSFSEYSESLKMNCFGELKNKEKFVSESSFLQGAYASDLKSVKSFQRLPNFLLSDIKKTYLIGKNPGEISVLPEESLPESWMPCWMIQCQSWNKFKAVFLGNRESFILKNNLKNPTKEKIKLWNQIVWHNRKRIKPDKKHVKKWKLFLKEVKNV